MRTTMGARWGMGLILAVALAGCQAGEPEDTSTTGQSFALSSCDSAEQCPAGFECEAFPCDVDCAADASGSCGSACAAGPICLPAPPTDCDPAQCPAGTVCTRACSGGCDADTNWCTDVACQVACQPVSTTPPVDPDERGCVTDFTDACLPPDYPVAARLDDVCAQQGLVLTEVSVAAECWPGAVQFTWTCCRAGGGVEPGQPSEPTCERRCDASGWCTERCCDPTTGQCWGSEVPVDPAPTCVALRSEQCLPEPEAKELLYKRCLEQNLQLVDLQPAEPCADGTFLFTYTCCADGAAPVTPWCDKGCDDTGTCFETCCDEAGNCWSNTYPGQPTEPPTEVCVQGATKECLPNVDPKERAYADCAAQNLELRELYEIGACPDGMPMFAWTCCGPSTTPTPDPNDPTVPTPWCDKKCDDAGTCTETCCDASGQCWSTTWPGEPVPPDPTACIAQVAGGDGTCTDVETLVAWASWQCAASGLVLGDHGAWGECDGGVLGLKFLCCP